MNFTLKKNSHFFHFSMLQRSESLMKSPLSTISSEKNYILNLVEKQHQLNSSVQEPLVGKNPSHMDSGSEPNNNWQIQSKFHHATGEEL